MTAPDPRAADALRAAGLPLRADAPHVRLECARVARLVLEREVKRVGFAPAGPEVAVPPLVLELGGCLAEQRGPIALVDGQGSWPCAAPLAAGAAPAERLAVTTWLGARLALLTPRAGPIHLGQLARLLAEEAGHFALLLVDLTGFDERGELPGGCELLDAVALVARSGHTRLGDVTRRLGELPREKQLGVLLTGT